MSTHLHAEQSGVIPTEAADVGEQPPRNGLHAQLGPQIDTYILWTKPSSVKETLIPNCPARNGNRSPGNTGERRATVTGFCCLMTVFFVFFPCVDTTAGSGHHSNHRLPPPEVPGCPGPLAAEVIHTDVLRCFVLGLGIAGERESVGGT